MQSEAQNDLKKLQDEATKILMQVASNKNQQSIEMQWLRSQIPSLLKLTKGGADGEEVQPVPPQQP